MSVLDQSIKIYLRTYFWWSFQMIDLREYLGLYWATEVSSLLLACWVFFCLVFVCFFQNCLSILSEVCQDLYFCVHNNFQNYFIEICDEKIVDVLVKSCMWGKKKSHFHVQETVQKPFTFHFKWIPCLSNMKIKSQYRKIPSTLPFGKPCFSHWTGWLVCFFPLYVNLGRKWQEIHDL